MVQCNNQLDSGATPSRLMCALNWSVIISIAIIIGTITVVSIIPQTGVILVLSRDFFSEGVRVLRV